MRRVFESSRIKEKDFVVLNAQSSNWNEMTVTRLPKDLSADIRDEMEVLDVLSCIDGSLEEVVVGLMDVSSSRAVLELLSFKFCCATHNLAFIDKSMFFDHYGVFLGIVVQFLNRSHMDVSFVWIGEGIDHMLNLGFSFLCIVALTNIVLR